MGGRLARVRRWVGLDDNPLRRRSDRVQGWLRLAVCALFVVGLVVAGVVGHAFYLRGLAAEQQAGQTYQVTARVVAVVTWTPVEGGGLVPHAVRVVWSDAAGGWHRQDVVTRAYQGESVRLWVGRDGRASPTRYSHTRTVVGAVVGGLSAATIATAGLFSVYLAAVLLIDRRRQARWDRGWLAVEPGWRKQVM
jgi:hypothetical protein